MNPELLLARQVRQRAARLGSQQPPSPAEAGARPRVADGARAASRARSQRDLRLRRRRHQPEGPVVVDLDVAPRRQRPERDLAHPQGDRDSGRAGGRRRSAAASEGLRRGAAARHRHQPLARRSIPVRLVLGHGRAEAVRRLRSVQSRRDRLGEARRHRPPPGAPGASGPTAERRAADGRDQPRRQAPLRDQLAVSHVGRAVLSRRDQGMAGEDRRAPERRHRRSILPDSMEFDGMRPHQVHLEGGDASSDSYCFA